MITDFSIPKKMQAIELAAYTENPETLQVVEKPVPKPSPGEVLIRMAAAPVNPSDLSSMAGRYANPKPLPFVPGLEGSGVIVASGGGTWGRILLGRRVACTASGMMDGTWAEYMVTGAYSCVPLRQSVTDEQGAMLFVNPLSAWAMIEIARTGGHRAIFQTAANSALGHMILKLGAKYGIQVISIVRRPEQLETLKKRGAGQVLISTSLDFPDELKSLSDSLNVTLALDAVAGALTGLLLQSMPRGSRVIVYGGLSGEGCLIDPRSLIFEDKRVEGFWLSDWVRNRNIFQLLKTILDVQANIGAALSSKVRSRVSLQEAPEAIRDYHTRMSDGKVLIVPDGHSTEEVGKSN